MRLVLAVALAALLSSTSAVAQAPSLAIDLGTATINGQYILDLGIEQVTDLLGRPTASESGFEDITGPRLHYHEIGLSFWFETKKKDPKQSVASATVYLSKTWDKDSRQHFQPFKNTLTPSVSASSKEQRVAEAIKDQAPEATSAEQAKRNYEKARLGRHLGSINLQDSLTTYSARHRTTYFFDPPSKFLERVVIAKRDR
jgi:hypothetical protein